MRSLYFAAGMLLFAAVPASAQDGSPPKTVAGAVQAVCPPGAPCAPTKALQRSFCETSGGCGIKKRRASANKTGFGKRRRKAYTSFGKGFSSKRNSIFKGSGVQGAKKSRKARHRRWRR